MKYMENMNVIAKISCYFERGVVTCLLYTSDAADE